LLVTIEEYVGHGRHRRLGVIQGPRGNIEDLSGEWDPIQPDSLGHMDTRIAAAAAAERRRLVCGVVDRLVLVELLGTLPELVTAERLLEL